MNDGYHHEEPTYVASTFTGSGGMGGGYQNLGTAPDQGGYQQFNAPQNSPGINGTAAPVGGVPQIVSHNARMLAPKITEKNLIVHGGTLDDVETTAGLSNISDDIDEVHFKTMVIRFDQDHPDITIGENADIASGLHTDTNVELIAATVEGLTGSDKAFGVNAGFYENDKLEWDQNFHVHASSGGHLGTYAALIRDAGNTHTVLRPPPVRTGKLPEGLEVSTLHEGIKDSLQEGKVMMAGDHFISQLMARQAIKNPQVKSSLEIFVMGDGSRVVQAPQETVMTLVHGLQNKFSESAKLRHLHNFHVAFHPLGLRNGESWEYIAKVNLVYAVPRTE
ncbi:MAG: hypothetical protein ACTSUE_18100 [Promethearchaeota archaeon]